MDTLLDMPQHEAARRVRDGGPVMLFVNPVEYHGPHLSLHNDRLVSEGVARRLAEAEGWPWLVGGHIEVGVDPCPGPGTRFTPYAMVRRDVVEACRALADLGAREVVLMTWHGAPLHNLALDAGVRWLRANGVAALAPFHLVVRKLQEDEEVENYGAALDAARPGAAREDLSRRLLRDVHAGFFETSLALCLAPLSVGDVHRSLPPCPEVTPMPTLAGASRLAAACGLRELAAELSVGAFSLGWTALRPFPGYTSLPSAATAEAGEAFLAIILRVYRDSVAAVLRDGAAPPRPVMPWVSWASLGGRLVGTGPIRRSDVLFGDTEPPAAEH